MTDSERDFTRDLYPFLHAPDATREAGTAAAFAEARRSTGQKARDIIELRRDVLAEYGPALTAAALAMAAAFAAGGTLLAFGNGGSATDAQDAAADCLAPPLPGWRPLPAVALTNDVGVLTGVANDVGFEHVFARQIIALARPGDIALGLSTSGGSASVVTALAQARRQGLLTVALSGGTGGVMAHTGAADHCFVARAEYVPRVQEAHATIWHTLLDLIQTVLAAGEGSA